MSLLDYRDEVESELTPTPMTAEEYLRLDARAEWIRGVTYFMSPVSLEHDKVRLWLHAVLDTLADAKNCGHVHGENVAVQITSDEMRCPDVSFFLHSNPAIQEMNVVVGIPDLAVEVVSPDSVKRDHIDKKRLYESHGVTEYLIVDLLKRAAFLYRLNSERHYEAVSELDGKLFSKVVPGFFFKPAWLNSPPMPLHAKVVGEMGVQ